MLDANKLLEEGIELVKSIGIKPGRIIPQVKVNSRAVNRFGLCTKKENGEFLIEISERLLHGKKEHAMNTMIHEILHTCYGCMNHGKRWQKHAKKVHEELGYKITRTSSFEEYDLKKPEGKYIIKCTGCKAEIHRHRKSALVRETNQFVCSGCKSELVRIK